MPLRIVAALGNPGPEYRDTRHNVGFLVAEECLRRWRRGSAVQEPDAVVASLRIGGNQVLVIQPRTYMNRSGLPVARIARARGCETSEILVIYDDADLPLGRIRIRIGGGSGGHRGVMSLLEELGTQDLMRIRLGIDKDDGELADRVLSPFRPEELPAVRTMVETATDAVAMIATEGMTAAMNRYNRRDEPAG